MGDYLYSRAVIELVRLDDLEPLRVLGRVTNEMTVGEMRQLLAHEPLEFSEESYDLLIQAKTASLLSGACEVGALRAAPAERAALRRFGEALGMAFQIVDDLLDYVGDPSVTGKPTGSDLREHKVTLPLIAALPADGRRRAPPGGSPDGPRRARTTPQIAEVIATVARGRRPRLRPGAGTPAGPAGRRRAGPAVALAGPGRAAGEHHLRRGPQALMAGPHRPGFYLGILVAGFIGGGAADRASPSDPARQRRPHVLHQHLDRQLRPCLGRPPGGKLHPGADRAPRVVAEPDRRRGGVPDRSFDLLGGPRGKPRFHRNHADHGRGPPALRRQATAGGGRVDRQGHTRVQAKPVGHSGRHHGFGRRAAEPAAPPDGRVGAAPSAQRVFRASRSGCRSRV